MKLIDLFEINSIISPSRSLHLNGEDSDWKTWHCLTLTRPESQALTPVSFIDIWRSPPWQDVGTWWWRCFEGL